MGSDKAKRNGRNTLWAMVLVTCSLCVYCAMDAEYREMKRRRYEDRIAHYTLCMEREQEWIARQQLPQGAICLYETEDGSLGTINPYFACLAARGLLAGESKEAELKCVEAYLKWHTGELVASRGLVCDYREEKGELLSIGEYDSVDSYIAVYLSLMAEYARKGGNLEGIPMLEEAVAVCIARLQELTRVGLTQVSLENTTCYLMDNAEVLDAYRQMRDLLASEEGAKHWKSKEVFLAYFSAAVKGAEKAMTERFWSAEEKHVEIGMDDEGNYLYFEGLDTFYPDAVAQIYPVAFDVWLTKEETIQKSYLEISERHSWKDGSMDTAFDWPVLAYVAAKLGDIRSAEEYIAEHCKRYQYDRSYPMNTANAGWVARSCEAVRDYYIEQAEKSLWDTFVERVMSSQRGEAYEGNECIWNETGGN